MDDKVRKCYSRQVYESIQGTDIVCVYKDLCPKATSVDRI